LNVEKNLKKDSNEEILIEILGDDIKMREDS